MFLVCFLFSGSALKHFVCTKKQSIQNCAHRGEMELINKPYLTIALWRGAVNARNMVLCELRCSHHLIALCASFVSKGKWGPSCCQCGLVADEVSASSPEVHHNEEAVSTCSRRVAGISPVWDVMPSGRACCASFALTFDWLAVNRSWTGDRSERNSARDTVYCTEADKMLTVSFLFCPAASTTGLPSYSITVIYII